MSIVTKTRLSVALKTHFRKKGTRTLDDLAGVAGFNVWKIAQEALKHMENEGFAVGGDRTVARVMAEFLAFLIASADRLVYGKLDDEERARFMNALAQHVAKTLENNQLDWFGPGEYRAPFIATLNARLPEYAERAYTADGPSYSYVRCLAEKVSDAMAGGDNKWVVEHVMDVEAPDMLKFLAKLTEAVLNTPRT